MFMFHVNSFIYLNSGLNQLIGCQSGMVVRIPSPINKLFNDASIAVKFYFLMFIRGISHGFYGTQD